MGIAYPGLAQQMQKVQHMAKVHQRSQRRETVEEGEQLRREGECLTVLGLDRLSQGGPAQSAQRFAVIARDIEVMAAHGVPFAARRIEARVTGPKRPAGMTSTPSAVKRA